MVKYYCYYTSSVITMKRYMMNYLLIYDFVWAGNCNLINIKVLMLFLPRGVHSECELLPLNCCWFHTFILWCTNGHLCKIYCVCQWCEHNLNWWHYRYIDAISCQLVILIKNLVKWVKSNGLALNLKKQNIRVFFKRKTSIYHHL